MKRVFIWISIICLISPLILYAERGTPLAGSLIGAFCLFIPVLLPFIITAIKKKRQLGKVWSGPLSASLFIAGKPLSCKHCGHVKFQKREGILVTSWVDFFGFSFWNHSGSCYSCIDCGHIEWFVSPKEENIEFTRKGD